MMKAFYIMSDHVVNVVIITFNWLALGEIGKIVGIVVGITWIVKNLIDIKNRWHKSSNNFDE